MVSILHFVVLNFVYPGEWFEIKKIFWFFAPKISEKYTALKEYQNIIEIDKKKKLFDIQEEINKFKDVKNLKDGDIKRLNELARQAAKINNTYIETNPTPAKPK